MIVKVTIDLIMSSIGRTGKETKSHFSTVPVGVDLIKKQEEPNPGGPRRAVCFGSARQDAAKCLLSRDRDCLAFQSLACDLGDFRAFLDADRIHAQLPGRNQRRTTPRERI